MFFPNFGGPIGLAPLSQITNIINYTRMQTKKTKKNIYLTILTAICLFMCANAEAQHSRMALHQPARNLVSPEKLEREIGFLTDTLCNGRAAGTRGNVEAAAWISRKFKEAGLMQFGSTWGKSFKASDDAAGHNIMGFLQGSSRRHPDKYVIIGAHYDHIGNIDGRMFPGADSNASGVVAMTSLAEMASMTRKAGRAYIHNVIFIAFDGKEMDMSGSEAVWDMISEGRLKDPISGKAITGDRVVLMINIDQIGSSLSPLREGRDDYMIVLDGKDGGSFPMSMLRSANTRYGLDMDLDFTYYGSENFTKLFYRISDQKVFVDNGIPAVMATSGITMNNNKTWDTVSTLNLEILRKRIYLLYHWLLMMI